MWAFAREASFRRACRDILTKEKFHKKEAELLQKHILKNFTSEKMHKEFVDVVLGADSGSKSVETPEETVLEF
jgi:activator of 2-hydroxyglutaryl-CoA dehydratase